MVVDDEEDQKGDNHSDHVNWRKDLLHFPVLWSRDNEVDRHEEEPSDKGPSLELRIIVEEDEH